MSFLSHLFRHCAWALSVFCLLALAMEWLIPDSVTPYLHLIPFAITAIMMLFLDAGISHERPSIVSRVVLIGLMFLLSLAIFIFYRESGMANMIAVGMMIVMMSGAGFFLMTKGEE
jgi:hypothetical protein